MTGTRVISYDEKTYTFDEAGDLLQIKGPMSIRSLAGSLAEFAQQILGDEVQVSASYNPLYEEITLRMRNNDPKNPKDSQQPNDPTVGDNNENQK